MTVTIARMGRKKSNKPTDVVRIGAELARMANLIATAEEKPVSDVIDPILDGPLRKLYEDTLKRLQKARADSSK